MDNNKKALMAVKIKDRIQQLGKEYSGLNIKSNAEIPVVNINSYKEISIDLESLLGNSNIPFADFFSGGNQVTFVPSELSLTRGMLTVLKKNPDEFMFRVKSKTGRSFLVFINELDNPLYMWELDMSEPEEEEEVEGAEGEDGEEEEADDF
jgi:hypothetical protein